MQTYEVLEKALEKIPDASYWCQCSQEQSRPGGGKQFCALGAVYSALADCNYNLSGPDPEFEGPAASLRSVVGGSVMLFNDMEGRTYEEVRDAFHRAIRKEKEKAGVSVDVPEPSIVQPIPAEV